MSLPAKIYMNCNGKQTPIGEVTGMTYKGMYSPAILGCNMYMYDYLDEIAMGIDLDKQFQEIDF
jgi:hypothetical protein